MTPPENAESMIWEFYNAHGPNLPYQTAKECSIICVEQIIDILEAFAYTGTFYDHFETGKMVTTEQANPVEYYRTVLDHINNY